MPEFIITYKGEQVAAKDLPLQVRFLLVLLMFADDNLRLRRFFKAAEADDLEEEYFSGDPKKDNEATAVSRLQSKVLEVDA